MKKVMMLLCAVCLLTAGCLDSLPIIGDDDDIVSEIAVAMSSDEIEAFLNDDALNITALADAEERFRVEIYTKGIEDGEIMEMTIISGKDEVSQLSEVGIKFQSGMMGLEYSIVQGASTDINIKVGNQWFLSRDAAPEYVDPFVDTGAEDSEDEDDNSSDDALTEEFLGLLPDLDEISFETVDLDWVVTIDQESLRQVAIASNDTHEITVEFLEIPPRLHSVEALSSNGSEAMSMTLDWGDAAALSLQSNIPKTSVTIEMSESFEVEDDDGDFTCDNNNTIPMSWVNDGWDDCGDNSDEGVDESELPQVISIWQGVVSEDHNQEVVLSEIEFHVGTVDDSDEFTVGITIALTTETANTTDSSGVWWETIYNDIDGDGFVSSGDTWQVSTNSSGTDDMELRFYDLWAEAYEGGPLPGFEVFFLLVALFLAAIQRRIVS